VPDKGSGPHTSPINPVQNMQPISEKRQPATIFGVAGIMCRRCGCEIVQIYGGTDVFIKKTRQPRDE
jgi:hypothetical protein